MTEDTNDIVYARKYKDTLFRMIFREKENLLSLYNAMNETNYTNPDDLEIVTLENAIYMEMKNDVAFLLYDELYLYEHQSTPNPNMPLRDLFYISREYEKLIGIPDKPGDLGMMGIKGKLPPSLYSSRKIRIPEPTFVVFYNGTREEPECSTLRLSDLYITKKTQPNLELCVQMFNINYGMNRDIMERCKILSDYAKFVDRIRKYAILLPIEDAMECAVQECINEGILSELLTKYRREVVQVSIFEFDAEKEWKLMRAAEREGWYEEGLKQGQELGALKQLFELVQKNILSVSVAAKEAGIEEAGFVERMKQEGYTLPSKC
ncbi:MAG: hypothetical protein IJY09_10230 [Lachnospiraceae bacterium]|nr:hypothetical protein [Lachnospiraceae bacterium]